MGRVKVLVSVVVEGEVRLAGFAEAGVFGVVAVDAFLDFVAVVFDESLYGPGGCVSECADGVSFDLFGQFPEHVDLGVVGFTDFHAFEGVSEPAGAFAAGGALAAAFVLVELAQAEDGLDDVGLLVHDDDCCGSESAFEVAEGVEVHEYILA